MKTVENPSAGRFDPPPPPREPLARVPFYQRWWFTPLLVLGYSAKFLVRSPQGKASLASVLIGIGLAAAQLLKKRAVQKDGGDTPYSPPTRLTR